MTFPTATAGLTIGRGALRQLHQSLLGHAPDQAINVLQEAGYASGEGVYRALCEWLSANTGGSVERPEDLDAGALSDELSAFFRTGGWGTLTVAPVGTGALAVDSTDWVEADPGSAQMPMCFFSSAMLGDVLGRISGESVVVMEVECRSKGDARCRFLTATPEVLQRVYEEMTQGRTYLEALGA
jgi:predicted hydrocarbon binding protein